MRQALLQCEEEEEKKTTPGKSTKIQHDGYVYKTVTAGWTEAFSVFAIYTQVFYRRMIYVMI